MIQLLGIFISDYADVIDVSKRLDKWLLDFGIMIGSIDYTKYEYLKLPAADTWGF